MFRMDKAYRDNGIAWIIIYHIINMNDKRTGAFLIRETQEVYETIFNNYSYLREKYGNL